MNLSYICPTCGAKSFIPLDSFDEMDFIKCPACGAVQSNSQNGSTPDSQQLDQLDFDKDLNPEQHAAATYDGPADGIMLMAGAGCGKTRTMIARALFLMKIKGVSPSRIAMLTFTRRAAKEICERVEKEIPGGSQHMFIGTFHRFCLNIMHRYARFFNNRDIMIMDRGDQEVIIRRIRSELRSETVGKIGKNTGIVPNEGNIISIFSYINNRRSTLNEYFEKYPPDNAETPELLQKAYDEYTEYKRQNGYLDFDDILTTVTEALEKEPELRNAIQKSLDYALVDEMQDTSPVQWDIIKALYPKIKLFCVGDDAQSIYSFRGADFESIHHFCDILPNSIRLKLTENYRSTQSILNTANALMDESELDYGKNLRAHSMQTGTPPRLLSFDNEQDEARSIVRIIAGKLADDVPPNEIMVMLRSIIHGRMLEHALRAYGIPYRIIGGVGFLQASHVKDVIATLQALALPKSEVSWMRFLPLLPRIAQKGAEKMYNAQEAASMNPADFLKLMGERIAVKSTEAGLFVAKEFDPDATPDKMLQQIINFYDRTGLLEKKYDKWCERRHDLDSLVQIASEYSNVKAFLESFLLDPDSEVSEQSNYSDCITLITVHSAKGTEADICFVMRAQSGSYPHYKSQDAAQVEEDRRVLYVAMTRARKELYLTEMHDIGTFYSHQMAGPSFLTRSVRSKLANARHSGYDYYD